MSNLASRLLSKVDKREDGCWMYTGGWTGAGYGAIDDKGKTLSAHVVSYEIHKGSVPKGLCVLHTCDNRWCIKPEHLFLGNHQINKDDEIAKGRHARGERQGHAKLKEVDVLTIYDLLEQGKSQAEIGRMYKVTPEAIGLINRGINWHYLFRERYL